MKPTIGITGATGAIGGRVAHLLGVTGQPLRLLARPGADVSRLPPGAFVAPATYADQEAMTHALAGVDTMLFVSGREHRDRLEHHRRVVAAATAAGVGKIVYTSFLGAAPDATFTLARHHFHTEEAIKQSGARYVFLRDSLYADLLPHFVVDDVIQGPAGTGRCAFVARADVAAAAAAALVSDRFDGSTFAITGPEALTLHEAASRLTSILGRPIRYLQETEEEAYASRARFGAPAWEVEGWVSSYLAIARGEMDAVSSAVEVLTGHPPQSLEDCLIP